MNVQSLKNVILEIQSELEQISVDFSSPEKNSPTLSLRHGNRMAPSPLIMTNETPSRCIRRHDVRHSSHSDSRHPNSTSTPKKRVPILGRRLFE